MELKELNEISTESVWECDSAEKADWAIEKIKEIRERRDMFINVAEQKIKTLKEQIEKQKESCDNQTSFFFGGVKSVSGHSSGKKDKDASFFGTSGRENSEEDFSPGFFER